MRQIILGLVAATAVLTASAAPAAACGGRGLFTSGCSPCGGVAYVSPCGGGYYGGGYASSSYYGSYGYGGGYGGGYGYGGVAAYQVLPRPTAQYYYANQGPVYGGPASFAPAPAYQQTSVADWGDDDGYGAAPSYSNVGYSYARPAYRTSYRPWRPRPAYYGGYRPRPAYYGYARPQVRYGYSRPAYAPSYGYRSSYRYAQPRVSYAPRYGHSHHPYHGYQRPLRRLY